ncbi:hypothetical protein VNO77_38890 [Canavalia gladiata]|uniref:Uncharacterized protein n=1 Tax=Canavalia gladiata TaxID=3824 RepID=A0AAN9PX96_CANGL
MHCDHVEGGFKAIAVPLVRSRASRRLNYAYGASKLQGDEGCNPKADDLIEPGVGMHQHSWQFITKPVTGEKTDLYVVDVRSKVQSLMEIVASGRVPR